MVPIEPGLPASLTRTDELLPQAVFHRYHSEHEMLRYLRRLADKDLALDRTMIPLGSCTMKLNATAEMIPITWPEFADVHPFSPAENVAGYLAMIHELESMLATITGYDAVSVQPNAGQPGRVRRADGDPRLPPLARRPRPHGVPDPVERPRDQRRQRGDGRPRRRSSSPATRREMSTWSTSTPSSPRRASASPRSC